MALIVVFARRNAGDRVTKPRPRVAQVCRVCRLAQSSPGAATGSVRPDDRQRDLPGRCARIGNAADREGGPALDGTDLELFAPMVGGGGAVFGASERRQAVRGR